MNKSELIDAVAKLTNLPKTKAGEAVDAVTETIKKSLKKGSDVALVGFGTFTVAARAARTGRNPATGGEIKIKASKTPKFRPGKNLKDAVNSK